MKRIVFPNRTCALADAELFKMAAGSKGWKAYTFVGDNPRSALIVSFETDEDENWSIKSNRTVRVTYTSYIPTTPIDEVPILLWERRVTIEQHRLDDNKLVLETYEVAAEVRMGAVFTMDTQDLIDWFSPLRGIELIADTESAANEISATGRMEGE